MSSRPSAFTLTSPGPLRLYSTTELLNLPAPTWLIDQVVPAGGLVGLYAPPWSGKTFVAIDMAMSVASGQPWHGHRVAQGPVLYVSAEGGVGIGKRVNAWLSYYNVKPSSTQVAWLIEAIPVYGDSESVDRLLTRIDEIEGADLPTLVVIDTLARCFDGDENTQVDMGRFIAGVDRLRRECGATVLVVHHTRLGADRERGNTAFRGAADAMIGLKPGKGSAFSLECDKQKDSVAFPTINLERHALGTRDEDSCVIIADAKEAVRKERVERVAHILDMDGPMKWEDWFSSCGLPRSTFQGVFTKLKESGQIIKEKDKWRMAGS